MKVLLALTIILGGVLISKNSYAVSQSQSTVSGSENLQVVPSNLPFAENAPGNTKPCKYLQGLMNAQKNGKLNASNSGPGGKVTAP